MRTSTVVMIGFAVVFGLLAVFVAQGWLNSQAERRMRSLEANKQPVSSATVVVAAKALRYGHQLTADHLREATWPEDAMPAGAFAKISDVLNGGRRVALAAIEPNEPILAAKVTGPGQRATLSALLRDGLKAVTIRVNDVDGVGGFVLPGDRVDVALTRQVDKTSASADVVLQNARVLAIDQLADERLENPKVVKAVTLEVDLVGAQKLSLAASVGSLSLMLRKAGEVDGEFTRRITLSDLGTASVPAAKVRADADMATVAVRRAATREEYSVPVEGTGLRAAAAGDR